MGEGKTSSFRRYAVVVVALCALGGLAVYVVTRPDETPARENGAAAQVSVPADLTPPATPAPESGAKSPAAPASEPVSQDEHYRQLVVGTWEDDYQGKRTMTLNADGTATMVVELSGMTATLFAKQLQFDMVWSLEDGRLKKHTTGGKPEGPVNLILKMMGDSVDEPILELTDSRLLLLDKNGETKYDWRRK